MGPIYKQIEIKLKTLNPTMLKIVDESYKHAGHQQMIGKECVESHFKITCKSKQFDGLTPLQRHRLVYSLLETEMKSIHALSLDLHP
jgi:stress-induced morphogen